MLKSMALRPPILPLILASGLIGLLGSTSVAQVTSDIALNGERISLEERSIKCDIDPTDIPKNVSTRRLADCYSAEHIVLDYDNKRVPAVRFTIEPDDKPISSGIRAELRDMHEAQNGEETWYRFSTLLPKDFPLDAKHRLVLAQWHERVHEDSESLRPPLSHRLWDGRFVVTLWNKDRIAQLGTAGDGEILFELPELQRGVFHEFAYKIVWSPGTDGQIIGWLRQCAVLDTECKDGTWEEIIRYSGSSGYDDADVVSYYFKLGLYTVTDFEVPFTVYHKGYRTGSRADEIGFTAPNLQ